MSVELIFIDVQKGCSQEIIKKLKEIPEIIEYNWILGNHDILARIDSSDIPQVIDNKLMTLENIIEIIIILT